MSLSNRITIKEVARVAGVSKQTISRVLNDHPDVSIETRQRILEIIDEMGYRPSAVARSLSWQRSYTLGVVTAGLKFNGPSMTLNGITGKAEELGYAVLLKELPKFYTEDSEPVFHSLLSRHVDGIIWAVPEVGDNQRWLKQQSPALPVPIIFLTSPPHSELPSVDYDNYLGGRIATRHLIEQGYRHIGHISGPLEWLAARQRKDGWNDTLLEAGIDTGEMHWTEGNWSPGSGERAFIQLLEKFPQLDAVFVANDQMVIGVYQAACKQGIKVPDQLGVVGFDDLVESAYLCPPLTSMRQDFQAHGYTAVQELVDRIEAIYKGEKGKEPKKIMLEPQIIVRESTSIR